jgi:hypothetical protein
LPSEIRKLIFTVDEARNAAVEHCLQKNIFMPDANIEDVILSNDADKMLVLKFSTTDPMDPSELSLNQEIVAAALIRFCGQNNVPLPRHGQKLLNVKDGKLIMMINVHAVRTQLV